MQNPSYLLVFILLFFASCRKNIVDCETNIECEKMLTGYWPQKGLFKNTIWVFLPNGMFEKFSVDRSADVDYIDSVINSGYVFNYEYSIINNNIIFVDTTNWYTPWSVPWTHEIIRLTHSNLKFKKEKQLHKIR